MYTDLTFDPLADQGGQDMNHSVVVDVRLPPRRSREANVGLFFNPSTCFPATATGAAASAASAATTTAVGGATPNRGTPIATCARFASVPAQQEIGCT